MKLIDPNAAFGNNARQVGTMLHCNRQSLLALLLTATLVAVQTALPWMHVGCEHDHSAAHASATESGHHHCGEHHHCHVVPANQPGPAFDHWHERLLSDDCAACRFLLLSSVPYEPVAICLVEQVSPHSAPLLIVAIAGEPMGLYRSRAPPALS
jgi:hypothetical protein